MTENKRKASGANGLESGADTPDRAAKRRKLQEEFGDLSKGETAESTTAYGHSILESIRHTTDKNGRSIAPFFENLPSKAGHADYYRQIKLPLSLGSIEHKLNSHEYECLSKLEGDFKRMVQNAKETNHRSSEIFSDAERVRKAVSNLMVKYNPAYKSGNYQAVATPIPDNPVANGDREGEDAEGEDEAEGNTNGDADANGEEDDEDAQGEEDGEDEEEGEEDEDDDEDDDDDDDDDEEEPIAVPKRRGPGRPPKNPELHAQKLAARAAGYSGKLDHQYENVPFKGLTFQKAQEKIVEEMIRKQDDSGEYTYFETFLYLPPRTLKDYFEVIAEPYSLKALQKQVIGKQGRREATYVSDFKGWTAFEDQSSLLWKNAYHYNEDGSEVFVLAQELEAFFYELLNEAKKHVQEPPQPQQKIKLKVPSGSEQPANPKKITIHVGNKTSTGSPAPGITHSTEGQPSRNGTPSIRNPFGGAASTTTLNLGQLDKARSMSASGASPSPSTSGLVKPEDAARASPAGMSISGGLAASQQQQITPTIAAFTPPIVQPPPPPKQTATDILEAQKYRPQPIDESQAILSKVELSSNPVAQGEKPVFITIPASKTEAHQEFLFNAPQSHYRLRIKPTVASFLETQQREWKLHVLLDGGRIYPSASAAHNEPLFDVNLHIGANRIEVALVAATPKGEIAPSGLNMELEKCIVHFNLLK